MEGQEKRKTIVAPSILSGEFSALGKSVEDAERWGADWIHCDVMDGVFVDNMTFGMPMIASLRKVTQLPLDVHLMITKPERYARRFVEAGADFVTFHPDASEDPKEVLRIIHEAGAKGGIALNPDVPFEPYAALFPECDLILVMSVFAGRGGQKFIPATYEKLNALRAYLAERGLKTQIEVDGGVGEQNAKELAAHGVNVLVAGSAIYRSADPAKTVKILGGEGE